jgi:hypothetical protein
METAEPCPYVRAVLKARTPFIVYASLAIAAPIVAIALCYGLGKPSMWIARSGAIMSGLSFLAGLKARDMADVFNDESFAGNSFGIARGKYGPQISRFVKLSTALVVIGTLVWGFGDELPIGYSS